MLINNREEYYNKIASSRDTWKQKNYYYYDQITQLYKFLVPYGKKVIEIGCGTGTLLASLKPSSGVGVDISESMLRIAKKKYPQFRYIHASAESLPINEAFDYVILSDVIGEVDDIQKTLEQLYKISNDNTRIIINYYNFLWEPILKFGEKIGLKMHQPEQNWLSKEDIKNLLTLANLDVIKESSYLLLPVYIPFLSHFVNKYIARIPLIRNLCLVRYFVARRNPVLFSDKEYSISIIIPARNEEGNIERAVKLIPQMGIHTQIIFVEGHSRDNTKEEIKKIIQQYKGEKDIQLVEQNGGIGKADAVRRGINRSNGEIIIIFDADLTVDPSELPKFYHALRTKKTEFIQGSRLVYPMEKDAMRILNMFGNILFSITFSFLLDQRIKDTLCGTKGIFRENYEKIAKGRSYFGDFDPFGDFDLIFGSSKMNLKIMEIPIRYKARAYGKTNISRFRHGLLLFKMTFFAAKKIKFF